MGQKSFRTIKGPWTQKVSKHLKKGKVKKTREFMKVGKGNAQHNRYDGHCVQQSIRIPKATWTSPSSGRRSTCQTSFSKVPLMKDDFYDDVLNGTPKTLILSNGVLNQDGVLKSSGKLKGDHATHF